MPFLNNDSHRAIIHQLNRHRRTKHPPRHLQPMLSLKPRRKTLNQRRRKLRLLRPYKARPVPLARVTSKRELTHNKHTPANINHRPIHLPIIIFKDPKPRTLVRPPVKQRPVVTSFNTHQKHQPAINPLSSCAITAPF